MANLEIVLHKSTILLIVVAALGYFVDIYDLILFSVVRVPSLRDLGLSGAEILDRGILLLNLQMAGMLVGGLLFGAIGDKFGRVSVLFSSILLYSLANFANGFVYDLNTYAALRFIAGLGLAGELGAGITLIAETLPREKRGIGTSLIASVGVSGALLAWEVSRIFNWRNAFIFGGVMGMVLLVLRLGVFESGLYKEVRNKDLPRGDWFFLLRSRDRLRRYLGLILLGAPLWYAVGILMTLAPELAEALEVKAPVEGGRAVFFYYLGLIAGDLGSGLLSQFFQSRKKSVAISLTAFTILLCVFFLVRGLSVDLFYGLCVALGLAGGYWATFVTMAAEQFGTNLRATVAISIPNFARGSLVLVSILFVALKNQVGITASGFSVGLLMMLLAFSSLLILRETYGLSMDYEET